MHVGCSRPHSDWEPGGAEAKREDQGRMAQPAGRISRPYLGIHCLLGKPQAAHIRFFIHSLSIGECYRITATGVLFLRTLGTTTNHPRKRLWASSRPAARRLAARSWSTHPVSCGERILRWYFHVYFSPSRLVVRRYLRRSASRCAARSVSTSEASNSPTGTVRVT